MAEIKDKIHPIEIIDKERPVKDILFMLGNDQPDVLLVMEQGKITGIVTDSDIIMKVKKSEMLSANIKVKDIMSSPVVSIESNRSMREAIDKMILNNIQKLLVLEKGVPIGILYGEDILDLDEDAWKELLFNQTVQEVYKILLREPESDLGEVSSMIREMDKFTNMESKVEFDLFTYQEGLIIVSYNYIKDNPNKSLEEIKSDIKENYQKLINLYCQ